MAQGDEISIRGMRSGSAVAAGRGASATIINHIQNIQQRALTAAEEAKQARDIELELLAQGVGALARRLQAQAVSPAEGDRPYMGLLAYSLGDAEIFCGREQAIRTLLDHLGRGPLTVLHAESGAGKTSLLQAGIAARLIEAGHLAVCLRPYDADPAEFVKRAFLPDLPQAPGLAALPLREFLQHARAMLDPQRALYLLLDQFEEFFALLTKTERRPFLQELADCLGDPSLNVLWVLALRAEAFSALAEFERYGIAPFKNACRLNCLTRAEAQEVMTEPAARRGLTFAPGLMDAILDSLESGGEIAPTQLQLVCSAVTEGPSSPQVITREKHDAQGGTEGILRDYLKQQLGQLPADERDCAWRLLRALITSELRRAVRAHDDLVDELKAQGVSRKMLGTVLARLVERRLLLMQEKTTGGERTYELAHDYLVKEIELDPKEQARKAAQELLEQEARAYVRYKTLMSEDRLRVIEPYRNELRFTPEAQALFDESLAAVQHEAAEREAQRQREFKLVEEKAETERRRAEEQARAASRLRTRNRIVTTVAALAAVSATIAFWFGVQTARQRDEADRQRQVALARQLAAQAQQVLDHQPSMLPRAVLLATESLLHSSTLEGDQALGDSLALLPREVARWTHEGLVLAVAFSPDGQWAASGGMDSTARVCEVATGREVARMTHGDRVSAVAFSPDGQWVVSGSWDETARVWEAATGREVARMTHDGFVHAVTFSPDGKWVASGSYDKTVRVWEAATGREVARLTHEASVDLVVFSPDDRWVASTGGNDQTARVWEAATGQEVARMTHEGHVSAVAFSPDGKWVASGSWDETARVWEAATGREVARMTHNNRVSAVAFSPDGQWVASGEEECRAATRPECPATARVWEAATGREVARMTHDGPVNTVIFSPDSKWVASGSSDKTARVWEAATGREVARMTHEDSVSAVAFSRDGRWVASGSSDKTARVWEVAIGREVARMSHGGYMSAVVFSPDGRWVASGSWDYTARVWEAATGREVARMRHGGPVSAVAFSPDGQRAASGSWDKTARVWEAATGHEVARMTHGSSVHAVAFSPDGQWVASGEGCAGGRLQCPATARVWEAATGREAARMTHDGDVNTVVFGPDGQWVASGSRDKTARVWKAATGREVARMTHEDSVSAVAFSPDGQWVVSGSVDKTARVWEAATGREVARMTYDQGVFLVAFSPDGKRVASGSPDKTAWWEVATRHEVARLTHDGSVIAVAFSPDGKWVASGGNDETARVWEVATGREVARLTHRGIVNTVAFSPDGKWVASGSWDETARVWRWLPQDLVELACSRLTRNLTQDEWKQYLPDEPYRKTCSQLPEGQ